MKRRKPYRKTDHICANCRFYDMENHKCSKDGAERDVKEFCPSLVMLDRRRDFGISICQNCGKEYMRRDKDQTFCCLPCARDSLKGATRTPRETRHCPLCNAPFVVRETSKRRYCSKKCWYASDEEKQLLKSVCKAVGGDSTGLEVLATNTNTREERFFPSIKLAAQFAGIPYKKFKNMLEYRFEYKGYKYELTGL